MVITKFSVLKVKGQGGAGTHTECLHAGSFYLLSFSKSNVALFPLISFDILTILLCTHCL